ncbi:hypothetical protein PDO_3734 [Rhizobium sp. PDO1-076]|nr:hypothetical protein PDO_3734 [Rhizobium sp. PDO1-076]
MAVGMSTRANPSGVFAVLHPLHQRETVASGPEGLACDSRALRRRFRFAGLAIPGVSESGTGHYGTAQNEGDESGCVLLKTLRNLEKSSPLRCVFKPVWQGQGKRRFRASGAMDAGPGPAYAVGAADRPVAVRQRWPFGGTDRRARH